MNHPASMVRKQQMPGGDEMACMFPFEPRHRGGVRFLPLVQFTTQPDSQRYTIWAVSP
jgi:hypothetical protein